MYNKKTLNRILVNMIVFILLIVSFASHSAIVSDNDGSAFVTKSEFEAIKKNFNNQVEQYNLSIDGKIDGAIASYLAGVRLSVEPQISWNTLTDKLGGNSLVFKNKFDDTTTSAITTEVNLSITRDLCAKGEWGITCGRRFFEAGWRYSDSYPNDHGQSYVSQSVWLMGFAGTNAGDYVRSDINQRLCEYRTTDTTHYQDEPTLQQYEYDLIFGGPRNWTLALSKCSFTKRPNMQASTTEAIEGNGKAFIYHKAANGNKYLREFANVWPILNIDVWRHDYKDYSFSTSSAFQSLYLVDNGKRITDAQINETATEHHEYGSWTQGTKYDGTSETSGTYISGSVIQMKANDGFDYSLYQYGTDLSGNIVCLQDTAVPKAKTTTSSFTATGMQFNATYFNEFGKRKQTNDFNDLKLTYTNIEQETESLDPSTIVNEYISNVAGENVYLGGGAPLIYTYDDGQEITLNLKFSSTGTSTDTVHYIVSDKQFVKGSVSGDATTIKEGNATVGTDVEVKISSGNKQQYWINMYSNTAGKDCTISDLKITYK